MPVMSGRLSRPSRAPQDEQRVLKELPGWFDLDGVAARLLRFEA